MAALNFSRLQDIPGIRQIGLLLALSGAVAVGLMVFFWSQKPGYAPLYSGLTDKDAAQVVQALQAANMEVQLDPNTGVVMVPEAKIREARLKLASEGLPQNTRFGIEIMEKDQGFGTSQFVENTRYQHALEVELARTIAELKPVKDARVHLALPKPSAFTQNHEPPSASILLELHSGRVMEQEQVAAIVHLVASSIPNLSPEHVTVVDQSGRMLTISDPNSDTAMSAAQFSQQLRLEANYIRRIHDLLEPLVGPGRVNAQVTVDMDFTVTEEAKESYVPDPAKLRSEQTNEQTSNMPAAQGVPGATSNTPPGTTSTSTTTAGTPMNASRSATRNFELDRSVSHTRSAPGRVRRVTAAVLLDHVPKAEQGKESTPQPLDEATLKRVENLTRQAIGFDEKRGDSISVMNAPFVHPSTTPDEEAVPLWKQPLMRDLVRYVLGAGLVVLLLFSVLRPTLKNLLAPLQVPQLLPALPDNSVEIPEVTVYSYEDKVRMTKNAIGQDPKRVAQVVKNWISHDE